MIEGIDVSHWEGQVDWSAVCGAGYRFAYTKATEGNYYFDDTYIANVSGAKANGIFIGAFHFYKLNIPAKAQADYFLSKTSTSQLDLPPVLDFEDPGTINKTQVAAGVKEWLDIVAAATKRTPIIYTSAYYWNTFAGMPTWAASYPLWVANYTSAAQPMLPKGWNDWLMWQYTDKGKVAGCMGGVDLNRTRLDEAGLLKLAGKTTTTIGGLVENAAIPLEERVHALERELEDIVKALQAKGIQV